MVIPGQFVCFSHNGQMSLKLFIFCPFILGGREGDLYHQKSKVLKKIMSEISTKTFAKACYLHSMFPHHTSGCGRKEKQIQYTSCVR